MFITVRFGNDRTVFCNPSCMAVNLINHLKGKCGFNETNLLIDLADNTGLIKDLQSHWNEYADKYLQPFQTYILIGRFERKEEGRGLMTPNSTNSLSPSPAPGEPESTRGNGPHPPPSEFVILLDNCKDIFPFFDLRTSEDGKTKRRRIRGMHQASKFLIQQKKQKIKKGSDKRKIHEI